MVVISVPGDKIVNGLIPVINTGNPTADSVIGVAVNQVFGAQVASSLGLNPTLDSSFLGDVLSPVLSTGVGLVSQVVGDTISNSKALGPFGPFVGDLAESVITSLGNDLTRSLFGGGEDGGEGTGGDLSSVWFPGAGGDDQGEWAADYGDSTFSSGMGGPDVVFSIRSAVFQVVREELSQTEVIGKEGAAAALAYLDKNPDDGEGARKAAIEAEMAAAKGLGVKYGEPSQLAAAGEAAEAAENTDGGATTPGQGGELPPPTTGEEPYNWQGIEWKFICTPDEISWETTAQADRVQIFGANRAPVISGVKGMRDLTLNNAIVEGFCRNKSVEDKIIYLEEMMNMSLGPNSKYVQVPVYKVQAQDKVYGLGTDDGGYFIIKSIRVQEKIRDLTGRTTRATVDISLMQVPSYQVDSGRDIASSFLASSKAPLTQISENLKAQSLENVKNQASQGQGTQGSGGGSQVVPSSPPAAPPSNRQVPEPTSGKPIRFR